MKAWTFHDFCFTARHRLVGRTDEAAKVHRHSYVVRFWFTGEPDQDELHATLAARFSHLNRSRLDLILEDSSDEGLAKWFLEAMRGRGCFRVCVTTDGHRGAQAA